MTENKEPNMNDVFDIRMEIYPETSEMVPLYSLWKGQTPIVYKLPLEGAMECLREHLESIAKEVAEGMSRLSGRTVTIQIHYVSVEGQTEIIGTVAVPDGITDDDIERLFHEWRQLASGEIADPDAENEDEDYKWCEPGTDFEFLQWLVERRNFGHSKELGEPLTLVW